MMTVEEAYALVLREGMKTEPVPDNAVPMLLHQGDSPSPERMSRLIEAIEIVHKAIESDTVIDKQLVGALWIIGVEANNAFGKGWQPQEEAVIVTLWESVESTVVGYWQVGHPRDKVR